MDKFLIAISSCWRFESNGWNNALRDTWLRDAEKLGIDYRFFFGNQLGIFPSKFPEDAVVVNTGDDYYSLMYKTFAKFRWVLDHGYETMFHCYHDTYACAERLVLPTGVDYFGDYYHQDPRQPWAHDSYGNSCQSGQGVFLSRRALKNVVEEFAKLDPSTLNIREEDWWTGASITKHSELVVQDTRNMTTNLTPNDQGPRRSNQIVSCHLSTIDPGGTWNKQGRETEWKYRPEFMYKLQREWEAS